jgi:isopenicillin-N N-acyltransferase-like protein
MSDPYPHLRVTGPPHDRGRRYGELARDRVHRSLALYRHQFETGAGWSWEQATAYASGFRPSIEAAFPAALEEIEGIADGAGVAADDILALNVRTEIMLPAIARRAAAECTALAVLPGGTAGGHPLIGQNWDWKPDCTRTAVVLEAEPDDGPPFVTVVEAGLLAKAGFNGAGIGLATNALITDEDRGDPGVPYHVVLRAILAARTLPEALDAVIRHRRASSANYLVASRDGMAVDIEAAAGDHSRVWLHWPEPHTLVHTNHLLAETGARDVGRWWAPDSPFRHRRATDLLAAHAGEVHPAMVQALLRDHVNHPAGICAHPDPAAPEEERTQTVASLVLDLASMTLWLSDGPPCEHPYRRVEYADFLDGSPG